MADIAPPKYVEYVLRTLEAAGFQAHPGAVRSNAHSSVAGIERSFVQ